MRDAAGTPPLGPATALALLAGVTAGALLPVLPPPWLAALALACGLALWWRRETPLRLSGAALAGVAWLCMHGALALAQQLPPDWERREVLLRGRIAELPVREPRRVRFVLDVDDAPDQPAPLRGRRLRLAWYDGHDGPAPQLRADERWQLVARLRAPRGLRNPGGLDAERHAVAQRIAATGYVRDPQRARRLAPRRGLPAWREAMAGRIGRSVPDDSARFVRALALGDTRELTDDDWDVLRANGLTHLVAISGFHVGLVAGLFALLARAAWWLVPGWGRRVPRPVAAAVAGALGALVYAAVAGFALPTVRTLLMIAVVAVSRAARWATTPARTLALAAFVVLAVDPLAVLGAGFWLSFVGVAWLIWCLPGHDRPWRAFLSAQGVATLGLLPLTVALFGQASLVGPLANLVAVPWWSLVVVPLALLGLLLETLHAGAGAPAWQAAAACFDLSWPLFERLAASPWAVWWLPEPRMFALPLAMLAAFWWLLPRGTPGKTLATLLWLPLLWPDRRLPQPGEFGLQVVDVGQGLAVLVRTARHTLLYDAGPAVPDGFDAGERAVVPALRALGVRGLDAVVISHADNDHAGGWPAVARAVPVRNLRAPEGAGVPSARTCRSGESWRWDGVRFTFLHPPPFFPYLRNESSCVLRIDGAHGSALLTGDIGEVVERMLVRAYGHTLRADVALVAHHGSGGSSDPAFVAAVRARHALVSSGHGNRFGHPLPHVLERWRQAGARTWITAETGALEVGARASGITVSAYRHANPRWWDAARRSGGQPRAGSGP
ncbi:MAG TPA: DNA internalization-related competence protein ComEC/Rec2 [Lysobacter sp.]|nr:DNA internalization-related competence protein ComEC/Rec2 [Lysobacter sp.]